MKKNLIFIGFLALILGFIGCTNYGTQLTFGNIEFYYTDDITEDEAEATGDYLEVIGLTEGEESSIQLAKDGDTYLFRVVAAEDYEDIENYEQNVKTFLYSYSAEILDGEEVEFHYCDEYFKTLEVIKMDDNSSDNTEYEDELDIEVYNETEIEYDNSVTFSEVDDLGNYLIDAGFTDGTTKSVILIKQRGTYIFKLVVDEASWNDPEYIDIASNFASNLSYDVFDGNPVEVYLCDDYFNTKTKVKM
jgi:hypothetical protein